MYHFVLDQVRARAGLQLVPHRGDAAQIGDHLPHIVHDVCHFLVRVVLTHGQAQRTVRHLVRQADGQQSASTMQAVYRLSWKKSRNTSIWM